MQDDPEWTIEDEQSWLLSEESDDAMYCHYYGPCDRCKRDTPEI